MSQENAEIAARNLIDLSRIEPVNPHDLVTISVRYQEFCENIVSDLRSLKSNLGHIGFMLVSPNNLPGASSQQMIDCLTFVDRVLSGGEDELEPFPPEPAFRKYIKQLANNVLNSENG